MATYSKNKNNLKELMHQIYFVFMSYDYLKFKQTLINTFSQNN